MKVVLSADDFGQQVEFQVVLVSVRNFGQKFKFELEPRQFSVLLFGSKFFSAKKLFFS